MAGGGDGVVIRWVASDDDQVNFVESGKQNLGSGAVLSIAWIEHHSLLLCGCRDGDVSVLSVTGLNILYKLKDHDGAVYGMDDGL